MTPVEEEIAYFYELGRTLRQWSEIEGLLLSLARACAVEELTKNAIGMGFTSIQGFRNKLLFVGAAVTRLLPAKHKDDWEKVQAKLFTESGKRNDLAHFRTLEFPQSSKGRRWALSPWQTRIGSDNTKPPEGSYCVLDLVIMRHSFAASNVKLANFIARICAQPAPFPESDEQPEDPPTIEQIRRRIHAELGHPQKSSREKRQEESALNAAASLVKTSDVVAKSHGDTGEHPEK